MIGGYYVSFCVHGPHGLRIECYFRAQAAAVAPDAYSMFLQSMHVQKQRCWIYERIPVTESMILQNHTVPDASKIDSEA